MTPEAHTARLRDARTAGMIDRYSARYPGIAGMVRRGYSAERIAELVGCEVWVVKMLKLSGRW